MLALPELDTYGCLERYARHPGNRSCVLGYAYLRMRAVAALRWDVFRTRTNDNLPYDLFMSMRLGAEYKKPRVITIDDIKAMSDTEKLSYYEKCCKLAGLEIDSDSSVGS